MVQVYLYVFVQANAIINVLVFLSRDRKIRMGAVNRGVGVTVNVKMTVNFTIKSCFLPLYTGYVHFRAKCMHIP